MCFVKALSILLFLFPCEEEDVGIGIDLGTTYSCVGVFINGQVEIIANSDGSRTTPSWISFSPTDQFVGEAARGRVARFPKDTIYNMKRIIGRRYGDKEVEREAAYSSFDLVNNSGLPCVQVPSRGICFTPEEISAEVLKKMKQIAEIYIGHPVRKAVITVPAYFNNAQRQATLEAGKLAGLDVLELLKEPTAAAIGYGKKKNYTTGKNILVYDLGGGTFDVSLLRIENNVFEVKGFDGDPYLGGEDFDRNVLNYYITLWKDNLGQDINGSKKAVERLRSAVERAKRMLSNFETGKWEINVESLCENEDFAETLTRANFNNLNSKLFEKTLPPLQRVLDLAKMSKSDVDEIVMVGGSSRILKVVELVTGFFDGKIPMQDINADEAVVYGAALRASMLTHDNKSCETPDEIVLVERTPLSVGVEDSVGGFSKIIERNAKIPCNGSIICTIVTDDQKNMRFVVYEGERPIASVNHYLNEFVFKEFVPGNRGDTKVNVTAGIDKNNILHVTARDAKSGDEMTLEIPPMTWRLSHRDVEDILYADQVLKDKEDQRKVDLLHEMEQHTYRLEKVFSVSSRTVLGKAEGDHVWSAVERARNFLGKKAGNVKIEEVEIELKLLKEVSPRLSSRHSILCLDGSGSMKRYFGGLVEAANAYIDVQLKEGGFFSVVVFSNYAQVLFEKEQRNVPAHTAFPALGTDFHHPLLRAIEIASRSQVSTPNLECRVVFFTDGEADTPTRECDELNRMKVRIDVVGFGSQSRLHELARGGGKVHQSGNFEEIKDIFIKIAASD